ncbi:hypothetical protein [Kineococcus sp. SYSU DK018]|uniref:hypothetical protein n=1 Tax=Kineococcus sp. SYSU DK018 TaxID=3383139 RepID=UPI003D7D5A7D
MASPQKPPQPSGGGSAASAFAFSAYGYEPARPAPPAPKPRPLGYDLEGIEKRLALLKRAQEQFAGWELDAVTRARGLKMSWDRIGELIGKSGETLRRRYSKNIP